MKYFLKSPWFLPAIWILAIIAVNPIGNFPLNDDWSYALNVFNLVEKGVLKFNDWAAMTQVTHLAAGVLATAVFGFSHTILRFVVILSVFGWIIYCGKKDSLFFQSGNIWFHLALIFNPLFFSLSFTYMTDVTYLIMFLISMDLIAREKWSSGGLLALAATLTRQTGVGIPASFLVQSIVFEKGKNAGKATLWTILLVAALVMYSVVMSHFGVISDNYSTPKQLTWILGHERPFARMGANLALILVYLGLFILPVLDIRQKWNLVHGIISLALFGLTMGRFPMSWEGNLLYGWGIGPVVLPGGNGFASVLPWVGYVLQLLGSVGGSAILVTVYETVRDKHSSLINRWGMVISAGFILFLLINQMFFDRYILMVVPFALLLMKKNKPIHAANIVFLVLMSLYSIIGTRNYLDWNRTRWNAFNDLIESGANHARIDGGFEVNGWLQNRQEREVDFSIGFFAPSGFAEIKTLEHGLKVFQKQGESGAKTSPDGMIRPSKENHD